MIPAIPYTPASPLLMTATRWPLTAAAIACSARSASRPMPRTTVRFPAT